MAKTLLDEIAVYTASLAPKTSAKAEESLGLVSRRAEPSQAASVDSSGLLYKPAVPGLAEHLPVLAGPSASIGLVELLPVLAEPLSVLAGPLALTGLVESAELAELTAWAHLLVLLIALPMTVPLLAEQTLDILAVTVFHMLEPATDLLERVESVLEKSEIPKLDGLHCLHFLVVEYHAWASFYGESSAALRFQSGAVH
jgi:hypothetical protein